MQIIDITTQNIIDFTIDKFIELARTDIVVMTISQWQQIINLNANENNIFTKITYLGFFTPEDDKNTFYLAIYTGETTPIGIPDEWTQITDLRIATPHNASIPLIMFRISQSITEQQSRFLKNFFDTIIGKKSDRIIIYGMVPTYFARDDERFRGDWFWIYGDTFRPLSKDITIQTLFPLPGRDNTVLFVDKTNNTHFFTFDPGKINFKKIETPRTVI